MEILAIKVGGTLSILLGIGHCYFYRGFGWGRDFKKISVLNARILYTIHIFLIPLFFLFGYLSWVYPAELAGETPIGITLTAFYSILWLLRTAWQIVYFRPSQFNKPTHLTFLHYFLISYFFMLWAAYSIPVAKHYLG